MSDNFGINQQIEFLTLDAMGGHPDAQLLLAMIYEKGEGVAQDDDASLQWYLMAANQGNITAQFNLSIKYLYGQGVPQSREEALTWCTRAADQGMGQALFDLGVIYHCGDSDSWIMRACKPNCVTAI